MDTDEQVFKMLSKLISDIINNIATNNFRLKSDFHEYILRLPDGYKSQVSKSDIDKQDDNKTGNSNDNDDNDNSNSQGDEVPGPEDKPEDDGTQSFESSVQSNNENEDLDNSNYQEPTEPKKITSHTKIVKTALRLSREYTDNEYSCLGEKGVQILKELESLNYNDYPQAAAGLCRSIIEYTVKLWMDEFSAEFSGNQLETYYNSCMNMLRNKKIIEDKQHKALMTSVNKEKFIDLLNGWIHSDSLLCVQAGTLENGWKANRILIELYIKEQSSK